MGYFFNNIYINMGAFIWNESSFYRPVYGFISFGWLFKYTSTKKNIEYVHANLGRIETANT